MLLEYRKVLPKFIPKWPLQTIPRGVEAMEVFLQHHAVAATGFTLTVP